MVRKRRMEEQWIIDMTANDWETLALVIKDQRNAPHLNETERAIIDNLALQIVRQLKTIRRNDKFLPEEWLASCR